MSLKPLSNLGYLKLRYLSKPATDREIFAEIKSRKIRSIVEIGMGDGTRVEKIVRVASKFGEKNIRYTGVDLFDGRPDGEAKLMLKDMHRKVNSLGVKAQLVPGDPAMAIQRIANSHTRTDLIVINAGYDPESLERSWFFVPRMLHANSVVLMQPSDAPAAKYQRLSRLEVERLAERKDESRKRATVAA